MKRGVVSGPNELIIAPDGKGFKACNLLSAVDLNYFTLYWDKLVIPTNNFYNFVLPNEKEMISCGVLERPRFIVGNMHSDDFPLFYADSQVKTIDILREQDRSIDWSLHFTGDQVHLPSQYANTTQAIRVEINGLLPVPTSDTPLHDILEFKQRRAPELEALHAHLDGLYLEIMSSGDVNLQRAKTLSALKSAIADLDKLNNEGWRTPIKLDVSTSFEFDLSQIVAGVSTAAAIMESQHANPMVAVGGGALAFIGGMIKVRPVIQSMRKGTDKKLTYLTKAYKEGIVKDSRE